MRARILPLGILILAVACSDSAPDAASDAAVKPDLALVPGDDGVPVASELEVPRPAEPERPEPDVPTPERDEQPEPESEPLGTAGGTDAVAANGGALHEHPRVDPESAVSAPVAVTEPASGGKPNPGVREGLGPVPDRRPRSPGILDDPAPIPTGLAGRNGPVLIRGGAGRIDDDCAIHARRGVGAAGAAMGEIDMGNGVERPGGALVNDRAPTARGSLGDRAPRARSGGSMPRGVGLPGGSGGRIRFR